MAQTLPAVVGPSVALTAVLGNGMASILACAPVCQFVSEGATRPSSVPCFLSTETASGEGEVFLLCINEFT